MKTNELRIENYLIDNTDRVSTVTELNNWEDGCYLVNDDFEGFSGFDEIKSIELTKKWLLTFGFKKMKNQDKMIDVFKKNNVIFWSQGDFLWIKIPKTKIKIRYVHQLQNLYFALTGEELEIK